MGRRTRRENRQAARQAGLYKEQTLPIITNEMLEDTFTKNTTVARARTDFADRLNGDGCMLFWEGKNGPTVTVHYKPELLPESARLAEKVDIAFFEVSSRLMFAIRAGKAYTPREATFTKKRQVRQKADHRSCAEVFTDGRQGVVEAVRSPGRRRAFRGQHKGGLTHGGDL